VIVDGPAPRQSALWRGKRERRRLAYVGIDAEHDRLNYRVIAVL
jgi:hypothetical protein